MFPYDLLQQNIDMDYNQSSFSSNLTYFKDIEIDSLMMNDEIENSISNYTSKYLSHILLGVIGIAICIIGIFGNIISIIVLSRQTMNKLSTYAYLIALSVCDAVGLLFTIIVLMQYSLPPDSIMPKWMVSSYPILLIYVYPIVTASQTLSVWITLAFTIDRYLYVCKPYLGSKLCTRRRSCYIICALYLLSIAHSIPQFFERKYEIVNISSKNSFIFSSLTEFGKSQTYFRIYHLYIYTIFICMIPFGTIAILNAFLIHNIMKSNKRHRDLHINILKNHSNSISYALVENTCPPIVKQAKSFLLSNKKKLFQQKMTTLTSNNNMNNSVSFSNSVYEQEVPLTGAGDGAGCNINSTTAAPRIRKTTAEYKRTVSNDIKYYDKSYRNDVTVLLIGLVIVFMICQLPSTILRLITYKNRFIMFDPVYVTLMDISNFLIVLNSTINCLLYVMLGKKFRKEFLRTICPNCYLKKKSTQIYLRRLSYFRNQNNNNNRNHHNHHHHQQHTLIPNLGDTVIANGGECTIQMDK